MLCLRSELMSQAKDELLMMYNFEQLPYYQLYEQSIAYHPEEKPFGNTYISWCEAWVKHIYSIPCDQHPLVATDVNTNEIVQEGPVFFLHGTIGGTVNRAVTIPQGKGIFFPVLNYTATYPCHMYPGFKPAPGQSLQDFLQINASTMVNQAANMSVSLDGVRINDVMPYRFTTPMFYFNASPELTCADPCITGELQPGLSDGYWIMLKPLSPGKHTLHYRGSYPKVGWVMDVTYEIEVK
jgi:hypothetical protein